MVQRSPVHCARELRRELQRPPRTGSRAALSPGENLQACGKHLRVHVWTVNDEDTMRRMWKLGVHGIMTDDPALLLRVTSELGRADKGI